MPCLFCNRFHEEICQKNPAYADGENDVKVQSGSLAQDEE